MKKSIDLTNDLYVSALENRDSLILSELLHLKGISFFSLGKYKESLDSYRKAYDYDSLILTDGDRQNIRLAEWEICGDTFANVWDTKVGEDKISDQSAISFVVLERQGRYKEAYKSLERYKSRQDSVFSLIFKNNVAESISKYDKIRSANRDEKLSNERLTYWIIILLFIVVGILVFWMLRERIFREKALRLKIEADLESLRSDLQSQLENSDYEDKSENANNKLNKDLKNIIKQKCAEINILCDDFYQGKYKRKDKDKFDVEINNVIMDFTEKSSIERIGEYIDDLSGCLYSSFKLDFFDLSEDNRRLFLYLMLRFSSRTISVILGQDISAIYNKKSRLKAKIVKSDFTRKGEYLKFF